MKSALLLAALVMACGGRAEEQLLRGYFDTCAVADAVALANVSTVTLDPVRDGVVGRFRVVTISRETGQPGWEDPRIIRLSLFDPQQPHDDSAILSMRVLELQAEMHRGGRVAEQPMSVTLARARTRETVGRWIVVRLVLDGRTLPEASSGPP